MSVSVCSVPEAEAGPPPLENGDHLSRAEFERRYHAMPRLKKAELIEGVVYLTPQVHHRGHARPHSQLICWLGVYTAATPRVEGGNSGSCRLDARNEVQPDALLLLDPNGVGQARISKDDFVEGAPELVGEIATRSASIELHTKLHVYRRNGVREYVVWRVEDQAIDWFVLRNSQYERSQPGPDGLLRSEVFPGLWLDAAALARQDMVQVAAALQRGLASAEHAAFVQRLQS